MSNDSARFPIENKDDVTLRALSGVPFEPNGRIQLPSGYIMSGSEAQVFSSLFGEDCSRFPDINRAKLLGQTIQLDTLPNPPAPQTKRSEYSSSWIRRIVWQFFRQ